MENNLVAVLAVALLTWGGVFFYVLRLESLARSLEREVEALRVCTIEENFEAPKTPIPSVNV